MNARQYLQIAFVSLALAGCTAPSDQALPTVAPPASSGPKIVPEAPADWTALAPVVSISIPADVSVDGAAQRTFKQKLDVFPQQKIIAFEAMPNGSSVQCVERGEDYGLKLVASPGASVTERTGCTGPGPLDAFRATFDYTTRSTSTGGALTIDAKGQVRSENFDDRTGALRRRLFYDIEVHGTIDIAAGTCRIRAWRHNVHVQSVNIDGGGYERDDLVQSAPGTACTLVLAK